LSAVAIENHSWHRADDGQTLAAPGPLAEAALASASAQGRSGAGRIFVWAAGDGRARGDNCNFDGYATSRFGIAVGAVDDTGQSAPYSEACSALLVSAPSSGAAGHRSLTTTDLLDADGFDPGDDTAAFGGTAAAAPVVSGVVALMLARNPALTWRDVQHILVRTSRPVASSDGGWTLGPFPHSEQYGFGIVDAEAAVTSAAMWTTVPPERVVGPVTHAVGALIPDGVGVSDVIRISSATRLSVEHVEVEFSATHPHRGDLEVTLTSPAGVVSHLGPARPGDGGADFARWRFRSVRHWGESAAGTWTLTVSDRASGHVGVFTGWTLRLYGTAMPPAAPRHLLDLNGDRSGDVFLYNKVTGERRFELFKAGGTGFTEIVKAWDPGWQVYLANLNGDAYVDAFLYDPVRGFWIQAINNGGDGTFTNTLGNWDKSWTVVPADLDGDGLTDIFVYNVATGVWAKCFVDGSGGFKAYAVGKWDPGWTLTTADLNGDGRDDLLLYNRVNGAWVEAFSQAGSGTFDYPASGVWDPGWQVTTGDLNGDGRMDLFLLNAAGVHVSALSAASGGFDYVVGPPWTPGWSVSSGDLNNDGLTDLFLYNAANGIWVEAFSDGAGRFTFAAGQWDPGWTAALTDFNGDGRADIIVSRADGTWMQITNTGDGTFTYVAGNWGAGFTVDTRQP